VLTLYHFNNSVCSEKVRMALKEKGVSWESREVDLFAGAQFAPEYLKLNPKGVVPTLIHDGHVLTESTLICEYIDEAFPAPALQPADAFERAKTRLYSKACDEGLHQGVAVLSYAAMFMDRLRRMPIEQLEVHLSRIPDLDRRDRQTAIYRDGIDAPHIYRGVAAYEKIFQKIDKTLADGRRWLAGDQYTLAEINLAVYVARLDYMNLLDLWLCERPRVVEWFGRIKGRPCYQTEVVDWVREDEWAEMRAGGTRIRSAIDAKRRHYVESDSAAALV
jgi:ganglioside-induced differentiation-associated protein 1